MSISLADRISHTGYWKPGRNPKPHTWSFVTMIPSLKGTGVDVVWSGSCTKVMPGDLEFFGLQRLKFQGITVETALKNGAKLEEARHRHEIPRKKKRR